MIPAPFPWFGGKSRAAPLIWERLGNPPNFVEPFAGSLAILLQRPQPPHIETVNDLDGFLCNVWRALAADPTAVEHWADWPANECDLHARHLWLKARRDTLTAALMGDPTYYDVQLAGWWLWGVAQWIGGGWCGDGGAGPWITRDGIFMKDEGTRGVSRQRLHLGNAGQGVSRRRLHLGNAGQGVSRQQQDLLSYFQALQDRLKRVRVCCGDWLRIMGPSVLENNGLTGIVLDPPYPGTERDRDLYGVENAEIAYAVREWAIAHGENPLLRIVLCGYESSQYTMPSTWEMVSWIPNGGMSNQGNGRGCVNKSRERLWFSQHCLSPVQSRLL